VASTNNPVSTHNGDWAGCGASPARWCNQTA